MNTNLSFEFLEFVRRAFRRQELLNSIDLLLKESVLKGNSSSRRHGYRFHWQVRNIYQQVFCHVCWSWIFSIFLKRIFLFAKYNLGSGIGKNLNNLYSNDKDVGFLFRGGKKGAVNLKQVTQFFFFFFGGTKENFDIVSFPFIFDNKKKNFYKGEMTMIDHRDQPRPTSSIFF